MTQAVFDLVRGLANKAHVLYGDNHHTNLKMFMELCVDDVYAASTARFNRKFYTNELYTNKDNYSCSSERVLQTQVKKP